MIKKIFASLFVVLMLCSCVTTKEIAYFQDSNSDEMEEIKAAITPVIKSGDILAILVSSSKPELAAPFNISSGINRNTPVGQDRVYESYTVGVDGNITLPILGSVKVAGLTREELTKELKGKLSALMPDPVVIVNYVNFRVTVLGEVSRPGAFNIQGDRITILEAVGMAGDLSVYGRRDNVLVIREVDGKRFMTRLDMKSKKLLNSPYFYLQQNDVVYVEPNNAKANTASMFRTNFPLYISAGSILVSIATLIVTLTK